MMLRTVAIGAVLSLWALSALASDEILPSDPRIIYANSLLDDKAKWPEAIELYEEVLEEDPNHTTARHWLARIHSWQGDYELAYAYYDELLSQEYPPADARIERAEVFSWAGDYAEAEAEFEAILAEDSSNERAARGLVRAYHWSDRAGDSAAAYQRALAISGGELNEEMRKLKDELDADLGLELDSDSSYFADSDGFRRFRVQVGGRYDIDRQTRLLASTAYTGVRSDLDFPSLPRSDDAFDVFAGIERQYGKRLRVNARLGFRHWSQAADRVLFRGEGEYTASERLALGLQFQYDDFLQQSDSLEALLAGLTVTSGRSWVWHEFNEVLSGYAYFDVGYISDSNTRVGLGVNYTYKPITRWDVSFGFLSNFLTYSERSLLYYDPVVDFKAAITALGRLNLPRGFSLDGGVDLGVSYAREGGISGVGVAFGIEGGPTWTDRNGYFISLRGRFARSQRSSAYDSGGAWLTVGKDL